MALPDFAQAWLAQRERGAARLAAAPLDLGPRETSGFVEQQRLFSRARR